MPNAFRIALAGILLGFSPGMATGGTSGTEDIDVETVQSAEVAPNSEEQDSTAALRLEYGTALAMAGDLEEAEAVFSALLSPGPQAAAAWSNLGNVHLIRGEATVARDLYDRSLDIEPNIPGVLLNRALARMMLGDVSGSREDAAIAMRDAGGLAEALDLLGIEAVDVRRAADEADNASFLSEEDVRALLVSALSAVPGESQNDSTAEASENTPTKEARTVWRPAGTRATGGGDLARLLHWQY